MVEASKRCTRSRTEAILKRPQILTTSKLYDSCGMFMNKHCIPSLEPETE
jgi:hypothetical protein